MVGDEPFFPASLTALDGCQWGAAIAGWQQAHPDRQMLG
jgi:hypothetical protein